MSNKSVSDDLPKEETTLRRSSRLNLQNNSPTRARVVTRRTSSTSETNNATVKNRRLSFDERGNAPKTEHEEKQPAQEEKITTRTTRAKAAKTTETTITSPEKLSPKITRRRSVTPSIETQEPARRITRRSSANQSVVEDNKPVTRSRRSSVNTEEQSEVIPRIDTPLKKSPTIPNKNELTEIIEEAKLEIEETKARSLKGRKSEAVKLDFGLEVISETSFIEEADKSITKELDRSTTNNKENISPRNKSDQMHGLTERLSSPTSNTLDSEQINVNQQSPGDVEGESDEKCHEKMDAPQMSELAVIEVVSSNTSLGSNDVHDELPEQRDDSVNKPNKTILEESKEISVTKELVNTEDCKSTNKNLPTAKDVAVLATTVSDKQSSPLRKSVSPKKNLLSTPRNQEEDSPQERRCSPRLKVSKEHPKECSGCTEMVTPVKMNDLNSSKAKGKQNESVHPPEAKHDESVLSECKELEKTLKEEILELKNSSIEITDVDSDKEEDDKVNEDPAETADQYEEEAIDAKSVDSEEIEQTVQIAPKYKYSINPDGKATKKKIVDAKEIEARIDALLSQTFEDASFDSSTDDSQHESPFIDGMAEEGEEDTPSEGSNDIIDLGESINSTESELSYHSYDRDSFIDDVEERSLLSGDEYDLSFESRKKKSRIIELSCDSDEEIVQIAKKTPKEKKRRSRIIKPSDSSDEEEKVENVPQEDISNVRDSLKDNEEKEPPRDVKKLVEFSEKDAIEEKLQKSLSPIKLNQSKRDEDSDQKQQKTPKATKLNQSRQSNVSQIVISPKKSIDSVSSPKIEPASSTPYKKPLNNSKKIIIHENIKVQDIKSKELSDKIHQAVDIFCSTIKNKSEGSFNVSLDISKEESTDSIAKKIVSPKKPVIKAPVRSAFEVFQQRHNKQKNKAQVINAPKIIQNQSENVTQAGPSKKRKHSKKVKKNDELKKAEAESIKKEDSKPDDLRYARSTKKQKHAEPVTKEEHPEVKTNKKHVTPIQVVDAAPVGGSKKSRRKRKLARNNSAQETANVIVEDEPVPKKKRLVRSAKPAFLGGVLDQSMETKMKKWRALIRTPSNVQLDDSWEVNPTRVQPSVAEQPIVNEATLKPTFKFHAKDFKSAMLFDSKRINRVNTKHVLAKKGIF